MPEAYGAPLDRWQSLQWQFNMATGALAALKRTAPQAHWPEMEFMQHYLPPAGTRTSAFDPPQTSLALFARSPAPPQPWSRKYIPFLRRIGGRIAVADGSTSSMKVVVSLVAVLILGAALAAVLLLQRGEWVGRVKEALGISTHLAPPDAGASEYRRRRLASFRAESAQADIVLLGDSHIENGDWASLLAGRSVLNRGIGWDTTQDVLGRLDEVIARKPRVVLIQIGIVDLRYGRDPATVAANIRSIAARLRDAGIRAYVHSVLPVSARLRETTNAKVRAVNDALRADPGFVDLHPVLVEDGALPPAMTTDGVHLSGPAYGLWAQRLAAVLDDATK